MMHNEKNLVGLHIIVQLGYPICLLEIYTGVCVVAITKQSFEHHESRRIIGEPTTATSLTIQVEVQDNARSVYTDMGGGENGHLALACTEEAYVALVPVQNHTNNQPIQRDYLSKNV